ncbi:hypothetical protein [Virgibacillus sp. DJP39]|uniref:hypothetical protein n=1 Tax=Virgibacillus sp. DJP39 TaxID=3409790 RepID=UPI003BB58DDC
METIVYVTDLKCITKGLDAMIEREQTCRACEGEGMLADDEGWKYKCSICDGDGKLDNGYTRDSAKLFNVDETNRLLD